MCACLLLIYVIMRCFMVVFGAKKMYHQLFVVYGMAATMCLCPDIACYDFCVSKPSCWSPPRGIMMHRSVL